MLEPILEFIRTFFNGFLGGIVGGIILLLVKEHYFEKVVLEAVEPDFLRLKKSLRVFLKIQNKGRTLAKDAMAYLTIKTDADALTKLIPEKNKLEKSCKGLPGWNFWDYLTPRGAKIVTEALPWTLPRDSVRGINEKPLRHLAYIPRNGYNKIALMDVYKVTYNNTKWYVLRIHAEYGTEDYPRTIIAIPATNPPIDRIEFEVLLTCANAREENTERIEVLLRNSNLFIRFKGRDHNVSQQLENLKEEDRCAKKVVEIVYKKISSG